MAGERKLTLGEVMGKVGASHATTGKIGFDNIKELLGENCPDMPKNAVGRHRLIRALQQRFGNNFRSLPGVSDIVKDFDRLVDVEIKIAKMKSIKYDAPKKGK